MINIGMERHIYTWHYSKDKGSTMVIGVRGDKAIFKLENGRVISGIIKRVGTKNIVIQTNGNLIGQRRTFLNWETIKTDDIKDFCIFPNGYQEYRYTKLY